MSPRPLIIAHRGASKYAPENSLAAIQRAIALGVDGIELDVQLTQDHIPVLIHGADLSPYTTTYPIVASAPLRALQAIDIGTQCGEAFRGTTVPTLQAALALLAPTRLLINLEIKSQPYWHFGLEQRCVELVRRYHLASRVVFSAFSPWSLVRLRHAAPDIPRGLILGQSAFLFLQAKFSGKFSKIHNLHLSEPAATPALVAFARAQGWNLWMWTLNTREALARALEFEAQGIITDDPLLAKEIVTAHYGI